MRFLRTVNAADKIKLFEFTYMVMIVLLLSAAVFTPVFIRRHFLLFKKYVIQEDAVEAVLIIILLLIAYLLSNIYKKELKKYQQETRRLTRNNSALSNRLTDAYKYIGGVNVQIQEIRSILCGLRRFPSTETAFKRDLALFARKVLGIVNADWVMIRLICQTNLRTMKEHLESRNNGNFMNKGISNKAIVDNRSIDGYSIVASRHDNSVIMGVCVFPKKNLNEEEKILVEAITNQIELLYHIFVSLRLQQNYPNCKSTTQIREKLTV